jgi:hypothetical protein
LYEHDSSGVIASGWGAIPLLILSSACGLALVTLADAMSRSGRTEGQALLWIGIALIVAPTAWRVTTSSATRGERILLVVLVGLALYAIKVVHDPFAFTFADEFVHQHNANEILRTGSLFNGNSILPITPLYPGLEALTAGVASTTGMTTFGAGLIVIAASRVIMMLAIYFLIESLSSSTRAGAIGALFYAAGPNFLFFSAQFSYESLALPLSASVLFMLVAMRSSEDARTSFGWGALALLTVPAVVVTHHVSAYILTLALVGTSGVSVFLSSYRTRHPLQSEKPLPPDAEVVPPPVTAPQSQLVGDRTFGDGLGGTDRTALIAAWRGATGTRSREDAFAYLSWLDRPTRFADEIIDTTLVRTSWRKAVSLRGRSPLPLATYTTTCVALWLVVVANTTTGYLSPVLSNAVDLTLKAATRDAPTRALFTSDAGAVSPRWERAVVIVSVLVLVMWLLLGLRALWKRLFRDAMLVVLTASALLYLATLPLRVVPAAWESAIRASSFLFVGVALLAAQARPRARPRRFAWVRLALVGFSATIMISGGVIAGWPTNLRLASPYRVKAEGTAIDPPGAAAARWSTQAIGTFNRIGAEQSDARLLMVYGPQEAIAGVFPAIDEVLHTPTIESWQPDLLRQLRLRYLMVDNRTNSSDVLAGYFFAPVGSRGAAERPPEVRDKFEHVSWADRVFDSGTIVLYDIHRLGNEQPPP